MSNLAGLQAYGQPGILSGIHFAMHQESNSTLLILRIRYISLWWKFESPWLHHGHGTMTVVGNRHCMDNTVDV